MYVNEWIMTDTDVIINMGTACEWFFLSLSILPILGVIVLLRGEDECDRIISLIWEYTFIFILYGCFYHCLDPILRISYCYFFCICYYVAWHNYIIYVYLVLPFSFFKGEEKKNNYLTSFFIFLIITIIYYFWVQKYKKQ